MTDPVTDETPQAAVEATQAPASDAGPAAEGTGGDDVSAGAAVERPRYRGWYWLGILIQVFVWTLIWLGIAIAVGVGGELTEFRYVGF